MIEDYINNNYGEYLDKFYIYENNDSLKLSTIVLNKENRESGIGTKIMTDIINYADKTGKIIVLTPATDYGGTKQRLIKFYRSFGFLWNRAHNKDFRFNDSMIRYPKNMNEEQIKGGLSDNKTLHDLVVHHGKDSWASIQFESLEKQLEKQLERGIKIESEHTSDNKIAMEIAMDHLWEDPKYYDKLNKMEKNESLKPLIKKLLREETKLNVTDETPEIITLVVEYNGRNAGIIIVKPANAEKTLEIVDINFKKDYETLYIINEAVKSLWGTFKNINSLIVAPKPEGIAFWNKLGFSRISPNYLILNRGH